MYGTERRGTEGYRTTIDEEEFEGGILENVRLGHDVRFVLAAVGGGAIRVGREIARRHLRYLETAAINCDPRVQGLEEFDRRVYLGPDSGTEVDTGGSPVVGGLLANAAQSALDRIFEGATFVTVVGSLGGGTGTGALPYVLEAASRHSEVLSAFVIKPFQCEGDRRSIADRALARLNFVDAFVEKQQRRLAILQILDNEYLGRRDRTLPLARLNAHWADVIASHIEKAFVIPAEASMEAHRLARLMESEPMNRPQLVEAIAVEIPEPAGPSSPLLPPLGPPAAPLMAPDAELTFEIEPPLRGPEAR